MKCDTCYNKGACLRELGYRLDVEQPEPDDVPLKEQEEGIENCENYKKDE